MDVRVHRYELRPRAGGPSRVGALLRVSDREGALGYADCHPWPELGDAPLEQELASLRADDPTFLVRRSLSLAEADRRARSAGRSLFEGLKIPESHALFPSVDALTSDAIEAAAAEGFRAIKIKVGPNPEAEATHLRQIRAATEACGLRVRLDFNARLTLAGALEFFEATQASPDWIDLVEDPCPYSPEAWEKIRRTFSVRLALDRTPHVSTATRGVDVFVLKPATQDPHSLAALARAHGKRLLVTSSLDHPVGQLGAAWVAATLGEQVESAGLVTHRVYEPTVFSRALGRGAWLTPPPGPGIGFAKELAALAWSKL